MDGCATTTSFSSIVESLKAMSLTLHACFELKSLDYGATTIEHVNFLPTKFSGDIFLNYLLFIIHWDIQNNCKIWIKSMMVTFNASCKLVTLKIHLNWVLKQWSALDICVVKMIFVLYFTVLLHTMRLLGVVIIFVASNIWAMFHEIPDLYH
jgi:hypothetical protein